MDLPEVLVIIPALNEETTIGSVIKNLRKTGFNQIVVVDDGSSDATTTVAREGGALVLKHIFNLGAGGATRTGLTYAKERGFPFAVTVDADGQHQVSDALRVAGEILKGESDIVVGSRFLRNEVDVPLLKRYTLRISNLITYLLFGVPTTDSQSGLRAFSRKVIETLEVESLGYEFCSGMFAQIKENGWNYAEMPINAIYSKYSLGKGQRLSNGFNIFLRLLSLKLGL